MTEILKRMCYKETTYGWYKCVANVVIVFQDGIFKCLFKSMSENKTCCWKTATQKINSIKDLQRLEGDLLRKGNVFDSPWSDHLVPELPIQELIKL